MKRFKTALQAEKTPWFEVMEKLAIVLVTSVIGFQSPILITTYWNRTGPVSSEGAVQVKLMVVKLSRAGLLWVTPPCMWAYWISRHWWNTCLLICIHNYNTMGKGEMPYSWLTFAGVQLERRALDDSGVENAPTTSPSSSLAWMRNPRKVPPAILLRVTEVRNSKWNFKSP